MMAGKLFNIHIGILAKVNFDWKTICYVKFVLRKK
jgi:hypothetical protein